MSKLERLYSLIENIEVAMLTTSNDDDLLVSRPMVTQQCEQDGKLYFVTTTATMKTDEIQADKFVNLAYYNDQNKHWVSISGKARLADDREKIRTLYDPSWSVWMSDEGGDKDGGPDDPRFILIEVEIVTAHFMSAPTGVAEVVL